MISQNMKRKHGGLEAGFFLAGITLLMMFFRVEADTGLQPGESRISIQAALNPVWIQDPYTSENVLAYVSEPDTSLWNAARITDYEDSLKVEASPPLGIFTIEKLNLRVPIYNGTD